MSNFISKALSGSEMDLVRAIAIQPLASGNRPFMEFVENELGEGKSDLELLRLAAGVDFIPLSIEQIVEMYRATCVDGHFRHGFTLNIHGDVAKVKIYPPRDNEAASGFLSELGNTNGAERGAGYGYKGFFTFRIFCYNDTLE